MNGNELYQFAKDLFPIGRSLTGPGVRRTLQMIGERIPNLRIVEVASGTQVHDWTIPDEWNIRAARLTDPEGRIIADYDVHNLHVVGYSEPIDRHLSFEELQSHLFTQPDLPTAIPYVTSYYRRNWGFCISENQRRELKSGTYHAYIDADLKPGSLTYGEVLLPGNSSEEILLSTYICHPSMGNNEVSGPVVTTGLAQWLSRLDTRRYSYRILFVPETIGSITYLAQHGSELKAKVKAGFVLTCVGDDRAYSFLPSRLGETLADKAALAAFKTLGLDYKTYSYLNRGSDERQYCSPGYDLPVVSMMRSKYGAYPEYHTSLDNLDLISPTGLGGAFELYKTCLELLEVNRVFHTKVLCEPQLGRRGLYSTTSQKGSSLASHTLLDFLAYCDGKHDLFDIALRLGKDPRELILVAETLRDHGLI